jgi:DNA-directed RNA polymerase I subunit RPA2
MRYLSHFRSVHRGAVFTEIRTTSVRKLTPESWGFLCPVHTPDGGLCGLLNHLTFMCEICTDEPNVSKLVALFESLGMIPIQSGSFRFQVKEAKVFFYEIILNGCVLGYIDEHAVDDFVIKIRYLKAKSTASNSNDLPKYMELCKIPKINLQNLTPFSLYPGVYVFTTPGRMMRPLTNLSTDSIEYVGSMEQAYLHVCIKPEEYIEGVCFKDCLHQISLFVHILWELLSFRQ